MDEGRFKRTWEVLRSGLIEGVAPGFVAGLWDVRRPDEIQVAALGQRRVFPSELEALPMETSTIFDLASLTKIMGTATLAAVLVDRGWISWNTPLDAILGGQGGPSYRSYPGVTLGHLLSHSAGFVAWRPLWEELREHFAPAPLYEISVKDRQKAMRELVFRIRPDRGPGEQVVYSDISFLLLGFALEEVTQLPLDVAIKRWVWQRMGLCEAFYRRVTTDASGSRLDRVAATEDSEWRGGVLQGQVHDDNCWAMGGYAGHAGAFGTVRDVLQFARALYPRPGVAGFLSPETLKAVWTPISEPVGACRTWGWDMPGGMPTGSDSSVGKLFSRRSIGHLGFTGTSLWIDPDAGLAVTLLSNRVHPSRDNIRIRLFRPRFHDAIRMDLGR
ncbi:serine hydrolase domain-containing protein [Bdellovibrionota bacterium FG-1]